jgi:DNA-binding MarR family transcriptional regulator
MSGRGGEDRAARIWRAMGDLVFDYDRKGHVSERLGMSFGRVRALRKLAEQEMSGRELAAALGVDPPWVTLMADDLEERGLVERTPHPTDRRRKLLVVTAEGRAVAEEAERILLEPPSALRALPAKDAEALDRIMAALVAARDDERP